jgi:hypothetical protein
MFTFNIIRKYFKTKNFIRSKVKTVSVEKCKNFPKIGSHNVYDKP